MVIKFAHDRLQKLSLQSWKVKVFESFFLFLFHSVSRQSTNKMPEWAEQSWLAGTHWYFYDRTRKTKGKSRQLNRAKLRDDRWFLLRNATLYRSVFAQTSHIRQAFFFWKMLMKSFLRSCFVWKWNSVIRGYFFTYIMLECIFKKCPFPNFKEEAFHMKSEEEIFKCMRMLEISKSTVTNETIIILSKIRMIIAEVIV